MLWLSLPLLAQQSTNRTVNVRAELARNEIEIGDQIYLDINISAPPGTTVYPIATEAVDGLPSIEVIEDEGLRTAAEQPELLLEQRLLITSFDTGYVAIPPIAIYFENASGRADTAYTTDFLLTVKGAVVSPEDDILPIKPIIEEPRNLLDFWWVFLILLLGLGYFAFREYRNRQVRPAPAAPPPPPPHERALSALDGLEQQQLWQNGKTDAYYVALTHILRTYLEERYRIPALEMTSRQITRELKDKVGLEERQRSELTELLQLSDLVKFAKATPPEELHPRSLERVREFVRETAPAPEMSTVKHD
jgi:hypothetical protein